MSYDRNILLMPKVMMIPIKTTTYYAYAYLNDDTNKDRLGVLMPKEMKIPIEIYK